MEGRADRARPTERAGQLTRLLPGREKVRRAEEGLEPMGPIQGPNENPFQAVGLGDAAEEHVQPVWSRMGGHSFGVGRTTFYCTVSFKPSESWGKW